MAEPAEKVFADRRMIGTRNDGGAEERVFGEIRRLGLEKNTRELDDQGYTVLAPDQVGPGGFAQSLRDGILACSEALTGVRPDLAEGRTHVDAMTRLGRGEILTDVLFFDRVFEQAVMTPSVLALVTYLLGESCVLASVNGVIKGPGAEYVPLHTDSIVPDPLTPYAQVCNATWLLTDYDVANGATLFLPGSHKKCRHPRDDESTDVSGAVPLVAPAGSVVIWHGNTWHGALPRTAPGLRVSLLTFFTRFYFRPPHETFTERMTQEILERNPERFAHLTGMRPRDKSKEFLTRTSQFA